MRRSAWVVLLVALLGACDDGDDGATSTTVPEATTTTVEGTTTTAAPDPFAVPADPADIDEAYVEAVLAELERINGDALRLMISEGASPTVAQMIESINAPEQTADSIQNLADAQAAGFEGFIRPPGDIVIRVNSILLASPACISVDVTEDYVAVATAGTTDAPTRIELVPSNGQNPILWEYLLRHPLDAGQDPPEPCESS